MHGKKDLLHKINEITSKNNDDYDNNKICDDYLSSLKRMKNMKRLLQV